MPAVTATAPAKTILFGEHAVVYDYPAIAVPVNALYVKTTVRPLISSKHSIIRFRNQNDESDIEMKNMDNTHPVVVCARALKQLINHPLPALEITIRSTIPIAAGLGSSAALAVSVTKALSAFLGLKLGVEEVNQIAYRSEEVQHGTPSGIDNTVISHNMPVLYKKSHPFHQIKIQSPFQVILADSGERSLTKNVVSDVRQVLKKDPDQTRSLFKKIGNLTENALQALEEGDTKAIGALMNVNHHALQALSVSSEMLDKLVATAVSNGAYGAKLCGAGRGGFMVAICKQTEVEIVCQSLVAAGAAQVLSTTIGA